MSPMSPAEQVTDTSLVMRRTLNASPERVFRAWTQPKEMERWLAPSPEMKTRVPQADVRVGGKYRVEMTQPDGVKHVAVGTYQEVKANERLVFTWRWEPEGAGDGGMEGMDAETLVSLDFRPAGQGKTEFTLTHERFPAKEATQKHLEGWQGCVARLEQALAA